MTALELIASIWSRRNYPTMATLTRKQTDFLCSLCKRELGHNLYPMNAFFSVEIDGITLQVMKNRIYSR